MNSLYFSVFSTIMRLERDTRKNNQAFVSSVLVSKEVIWKDREFSNAG